MVKYEVIEELGNNIEIRKYPDMIAIFTQCKNRYSAFSALSGYIFGNNEKKTKIKMTAPVLLMYGEMNPVMSFILPEDFTMENTPAPLSGRVSVGQVDSKVLLVSSSRGNLNRKRREEMEVLLEEKIKELALKRKGNFFQMSYNPPWIPSFMKKNEIAIVLDYA